MMIILHRALAFLLVTCITLSGWNTPAVFAGTLAKATFAGGCFWCMEKPFDQLQGVISTTSGYAGGTTINPTYKQVSSGKTGHAEAVQVVYDPEKVSYEKLLSVFWQNVDPLDAGGQFCDRGNQYRSSIFYHTPAQRQFAEKSKQTLTSTKKFSQPIATQIVPLNQFYPAENYHQDYYKNNSAKYNFYRFACGRDKRLAELWGKTTASH